MANLDLDALERETVPDPYTVTWQGKTWTLRDPQEMPYQEIRQVNELAATGRWVEVISYLLPADVRDEFFAAAPLPLWKAQRMAEGHRAHYALTSVGEADASHTS